MTKYYLILSLKESTFSSARTNFTGRKEMPIMSSLKKQNLGNHNGKSSNRNYRPIILIILLLIPFLFVGYFYVYIPFKEGSTHVNPFEKISITSVNVKTTDRMVIELKYKNDGGSDANLTNIFIDNKHLSSYSTFVDIYDASGSSIKNLLNGTRYLMPTEKEGKFTMVFMVDAFASGQVINIGLGTYVSQQRSTPKFLYSTSCKVP